MQICAKNNTGTFQAILDWRSRQIGDKISLVFYEENYSKKFNLSKNKSRVMPLRLLTVKNVILRKK